VSAPRSSRPAARRHPAPLTEPALAARTQHFTAQCRRAGMNVTPQRIAIYRALLEAVDHPSPEAIFARVRPTMPSLSLATIYKTLEALARLGLVSELSTTGKARRYDGNRDQHHHLVCTRCHSVTDYYDPALDRVPPPGRLAGFRARTVTVHIHGLCAACASTAGPQRSSPSTTGR
jgi:Fur family peroxide stress response transcriptional regulator